MCSTPKRTGTLFRAARIKEENAGYASMLRRASQRMDRIQCEREAQQDREQADKPRPVPESSLLCRTPLNCPACPVSGIT